MSDIGSASRQGVAEGQTGLNGSDNRASHTEDDVTDPKVSIVVPAVNESLTISELSRGANRAFATPGSVAKSSLWTVRTTALRSSLWRRSPGTAYSKTGT